MSQEGQPPAAPPQPAPQVPGADKKLLAGLLGILLGWTGAHKFALGYKTEGAIMLGISVVTLCFGAIIPSVIGIIEGIIYLTKSDQEFVDTYINGKKGWF